jgi:hypothetical protein
LVLTARRKLLGAQRLCGTAKGIVIRGVIADLDSPRKRLWVQGFRITSNNITEFVLTARRKLLRRRTGWGIGKFVADFDPRRKRLRVQRFWITLNNITRFVLTARRKRLGVQWLCDAANVTSGVGIWG